jgi:hypothetical protein
LIEKAADSHSGAELLSEAMLHINVVSSEAVTTRVPSGLKLAEMT